RDHPPNEDSSLRRRLGPVAQLGSCQKIPQRHTHQHVAQPDLRSEVKRKNARNPASATSRKSDQKARNRAPLASPDPTPAVSAASITSGVFTSHTTKWCIPQ